MIDPFEELQQIRKQQEQLAQLVSQALKQPPHFTISDQAVAERLAQMLPARLERTAQAMEATVARIPSHISVESEILGFASLKSLLVFSGVFFVMLFGTGWYAVHTRDEWHELEIKNSTHDKFVKWVIQNQPKVIDEYNQSLNRKNK